MKSRQRFLASILGVAVAMACGHVRDGEGHTTPEPSRDAGPDEDPDAAVVKPPPPPPRDAGLPVPFEASLPPPDAAEPPAEAGPPLDAGAPPIVPVDAGICGGCFEAKIFRGVPGRTCFEVAEEIHVGCSCSWDDFDRFCWVNLQDRSLAWTTSRTIHMPATEWAPCSPAERLVGHTSCEFLHCARPPRACVADHYCDHGDCDSAFAYPDGCRRPPCSADGECPSDERCVRGDCAPSTRCTRLGKECLCENYDGCLQGAACAPVDRFGPRGTWDEVVIQRQFASCAKGDCKTEYVLTSDGHITIRRSGTEVTRLLPGAIADLVDGPGLRPALRDAHCTADASGMSLVVSLHLDTGALTAEVGSCLADADVGHPALAELYSIVEFL